MHIHMHNLRSFVTYLLIHIYIYKYIYNIYITDDQFLYIYL